MEKASQVIRRGSVRLRAISTGHSELNLVLCGLRNLRIASKNFVHAQRTAAQDLLRWSSKTENRAIQDTFSQLYELNVMWEDIQKEFTEHLKEFRNQFDLIYESEKQIDQARGHLAICESSETNVKRDLKKAVKKSYPDDINQLEMKLAQAQRTKDLAQLDVVDKVQENEAVKLIRVKESLLKLSDSYLELAQKCQIVFQSHREIALQLPDVQDKCIHDLRYTGSLAAKQAVVRAREQLHQHKRQSCCLPSPRDPPPPYSPSFTNVSLPYPEQLNPFCAEDPSVLHTSSGPFVVNRQASTTSLPPSETRSPCNSAGSPPYYAMPPRVQEEEEELVGAVGGLQL